MNSVPQHYPPLSLSDIMAEGGASRRFKSPHPLKAALRWRDASTQMEVDGAMCVDRRHLLQ